MKLKLQTHEMFDCPEGKYRGVIERIGEPNKPINKPCQQQIRITVRVKTAQNKDYLVARTFCAELIQGSELHNFLDTWLEGAVEEIVDSNCELDFNLLIGKQVDVLVQHHYLGNEKPFVQLAGIFAPGTLVED